MAKFFIYKDKIVSEFIVFFKKSILKFLLCAFALFSCSGLEQSEEERARRMNACGEHIERLAEDCNFVIEAPVRKVRDPYPWEESIVGGHRRITKEFFQCKGDGGNPMLTRHTQSGRPLEHFDCAGGKKHSLCLKDGKEFVYPILLDLLNYVQKKTERKVIITCGHRCPAHNTYADPSNFNLNSKHMIGAEVDFYVEGMERSPQVIVDILLDYYQGNEFGSFQRFEPSKTDVETPPWYNKEVFIKLYKEHEGRDLDNQHSYPYIAIQVRYDRERDERVTYSWDLANKNIRQY